MGKEDGSGKDEIKSIEEEIRKTQYNKHTQYHIGKLKAKLARLRETREKRKGVGVGGRQYSVKKTGDATVLLVGFPSVGKSTLLSRITNADSKVGDYDFTTLDIIPGVLEYNSAKIQVLDVPGLVKGASEGKGRGKEILSVMRNADLVILMIDREGQLEVLGSELYNAGFRLDQKPPDVMIKRNDTGGIRIGSTVRLKHLDHRMIKDVLNEYRIHNAEVLIRENLTPDRFIDSLCRNRVYVPSVTIFNKADLLTGEGREDIERKGWLPVSAERGTNLEALKGVIWEKLGLIRVYMKRTGRDPDMEEPLIMGKGSTVGDVARKIRNEWRAEYARIWGPSARFGGQRVSPSKGLRDGDTVELHLE